MCTFTPCLDARVGHSLNKQPPTPPVTSDPHLIYLCVCELSEMAATSDVSSSHAILGCLYLMFSKQAQLPFTPPITFDPHHIYLCVCEFIRDGRHIGCEQLTRHIGVLVLDALFGFICGVLCDETH